MLLVLYSGKILFGSIQNEYSNGYTKIVIGNYFWVIILFLKYPEHCEKYWEYSRNKIYEKNEFISQLVWLVGGNLLDISDIRKWTKNTGYKEG